ncbi:MAG: MarR family transcriptional regulator [Cohnella sp.]|nr:MarR family transcriptional regulator [Cohnella sp.]
MNRHELLFSYSEKFINHQKMWEAEWAKTNTCGLSVGQAYMIRVLKRVGPLQAKDLISLMSISSGGVTVVSDKLIKKGYIRKTKDEKDLRASYIELTEQGREIYEVIMRDWFKVMDTIFGVLSDVEVAILQQLFTRLVDRK